MVEALESPALEVVGVGTPPAGRYDLLLIDLNREAKERLAWLTRVGADEFPTEVVCFGPHTQMAELSQLARAAGAGRCVANSHLPLTLRRWREAREGVAPQLLGDPD
ncbi:MAG: hypothetical protein ACREN1_03015 [Candidatus Dormibacteria bacterium]